MSIIYPNNNPNLFRTNQLNNIPYRNIYCQMQDLTSLYIQKLSIFNRSFFPISQIRAQIEKLRIFWPIRKNSKIGLK